MLFPIEHKRQAGLGMIEVLISLVVLAIGLLGVGAMQISSLRDNQRAGYRAQATMLVDELADRMRANKPALSLGNSNPYNGVTTAFATTPNCSSGCTAANMGKADINDWYGELTRRLPSGAVAKITCIPIDAACAADSPYAVCLRWRESRGLFTGTPESAADDTRCPTLSAGDGVVQTLVIEFQP
ncbi:MAG: type IV pilus modification protein PilV [Chromatiales bacterium]|nr:type IV pilus modification protein PilV [Chromatiales bacterium]